MIFTEIQNLANVSTSIASLVGAAIGLVFGILVNRRKLKIANKKLAAAENEEHKTSYEVKHAKVSKIAGDVERRKREKDNLETKIRDCRDRIEMQNKKLIERKAEKSNIDREINKIQNATLETQEILDNLESELAALNELLQRTEYSYSKENSKLKKLERK